MRRTTIVLITILLAVCFVALYRVSNNRWLHSFSHKPSVTPPHSDELTLSSHWLKSLNSIEEVYPLKNRLIIRTTGGPVVVQWQPVYRLKELKTQLFTFTVNDAVQDEYGTIWCGTDRGLARFENSQLHFQNDIQWPVKRLKIFDGYLYIMGEHQIVERRQIGGDRHSVVESSGNRDTLSQKDSAHDKRIPMQGGSNGGSRYLFYDIDEGGTNPNDRRRLIGYNRHSRQWELVVTTVPKGSVHQILSFNNRTISLNFDTYGEQMHYHGLYQLLESKWLPLVIVIPGIEEGMSREPKWSAATVVDGYLYLASHLGVAKVDDSWNVDFIPFPSEFELYGVRASCIAVEGDEIWLGTARGLGHYDGNEWFFTYLSNTISDNEVRKIVSQPPYVLVKCAKGVSLKDLNSNDWIHFTADLPAYYTLSHRNNSNSAIFRLLGDIKTREYLRFQKWEVTAGKLESHNRWYELQPLMIPKGEKVTLFESDLQGNVWVAVKPFLYRYYGGTWQRFGFKLEQRLDKKMLQVTELGFASEPDSQINPVEVLAMKSDNSRTIFSLQGIGWRAMLQYRDRRWNSLLYKSRISPDLKLLAVHEKGVYVQEQGKLLLYSGELPSTLWEHSSAVRILDCLARGNFLLFSTVEVQPQGVHYDLHYLSSRGDTRISEYLNGSLPRINDMAVVKDNIWCATREGLLVVHGFPLKEKDGSTSHQKSQLVALGDISEATIGLPQHIPSTLTPAVLPAFNPSGTECVYIAIIGEKRKLFRYQFSERRNIEIRLPEEFDQIYKPSFTPDGKKILFYALHRGDEDIYLYDRVSHKLQRITRTRGKDWDPAMDIRGRFIVYTSNRWGSNDVYLLNLADKKTMRVTDARTSEWHPSLSPDARKIVYVKSSKENAGDLWLYDMSTGKHSSLITTPEKEWLPRWSPDGMYIAYCKKRGGFHHIYLYDISQKKELQITYGPYNDLAPSWSMDGKNLIFHSDRRGSKSLWKVVLR